MQRDGGLNRTSTKEEMKLGRKLKQAGTGQASEGSCRSTATRVSWQNTLPVQTGAKGQARLSGLGGRLLVILEPVKDQ